MLEAAVALIAEKGFERTTAVEIGERAGFSRELVRRRYGSKEALLESLLETEYAPRLLDDTRQEGGTGMQRLHQLADRVLDQARKEPDLLRTFFVLCFEAVAPVPAVRPWVTAWLVRYQTAIADAICVGQADGTIRSVVEPTRAAHAILADGMGRAYMWVLAPMETDFVNDLADWRDQFTQRFTPLTT
jgi:AcrR family transcriptional regulator